MLIRRAELPVIYACDSLPVGIVILASEHTVGTVLTVGGALTDGGVLTVGVGTTF